MLQEEHVDLLTRYQDYRSALPPETVEELKGKSFAVEFAPPDTWRIIRSDEDQERLAAWVQASGLELANIVWDQIPDESVTGGASLL